MKQKTYTAKVIESIDQSMIKLDHQVKKVLACRPILARILKGVVEECHELSIEDVECCIEGEIYIEKIPVEPGLTNSIIGQAVEDFQNQEGLIIYDIRTYLRLPTKNTPEQVKIIINIEAQKDDKPGYDLSLRALFYCCRMISAQLGQEFSTSTDDPVKYGNIKKVYSIFICSNAAQIRANSIEQYRIIKEMLHGRNSDDLRYDIMRAIIINISKTHNTEGNDNELIAMLTDLLNEDMEAAEIKYIRGKTWDSHDGRNKAGGGKYV